MANGPGFLDARAPAPGESGHVTSIALPEPVELRVDIGSRAGGERLSIAVTVFLPALAPNAAQPAIVIFAVPGGGYSRGYFDMFFPGHHNYSEARYHQSNGFIFVACDPVGVGDSSLPEPASIDFCMLGDCYDAAVREMVDRLRRGTAAQGQTAISSLTCLGIGQSMGGKVTILAQGRNATFDGIGVLGASAIHTVLPQRDERARQTMLEAHHLPRGSVVDATTVARSSESIAYFVYPFHYEDVPQDILRADIGGGYPQRRAPVPRFASATIPPCAVTMMSPGCVAGEAAAIKVPVFIGVGKRDVCPAPRDEPRAYVNSDDVTVSIVPRMAHMHNFASTRAVLWDRIEDWARGVARAKQQRGES